MKANPSSLPNGTDVLLTTRQLLEIIPVCGMTIWRWEKNQKIGFPRRLKLNGGHNYWRLSEIRAWIAKQSADERDEGFPKTDKEAKADKETPPDGHPADKEGERPAA